MSSSDRIEKQIVIRAPLSRVWAALSDSQAFGAWFGAEFEGPFVAGTRVMARIRPTTVDPEVAKQQEPFAGTPFSILVEQVEAPRRLSFRWQPHVDPPASDAKDLTTLVVFELTEVADGTHLQIVESGFDRIPLAQRAKAFSNNEQGWEHQAKLIAKYVQADAAQ
jgi:uncharacterized protein YndB with AHSA1/START domain